MKNRYGVIAHVPPKVHGFDSSTFLANLNENLPASPLVLFGVDGNGPVRPIPDFRPLVKGPKWPHLSNYAFLTALEIAEDEGWSHVVYIEEDCRFGIPGWDEELIRDYEANPRAVMGGTPAIWHYGPSALSNKYLQAFIERTRRETDQRAPLFFDKNGFSHGEEHSRSPWLHPIGALAIYNLKWLRSVFPREADKAKSASGMGPFDVELGKALWTTYGNEQFSHFATFTRSFSGYKDQLLTLTQRAERLLDGSLVAIHPVKEGKTLAQLVVST